MCFLWCELGTHELLVRYSRLPMAMGQRILLGLWVKEDSGCRSSWLPLIEAFWLIGSSVHVMLMASAVVLWIWGLTYVLMEGSVEVSAGRSMYDKP